MGCVDPIPSELTSITVLQTSLGPFSTPSQAVFSPRYRAELLMMLKKEFDFVSMTGSGSMDCLLIIDEISSSCQIFCQQVHLTIVSDQNPVLEMVLLVSRKDEADDLNTGNFCIICNYLSCRLPASQSLPGSVNVQWNPVSPRLPSRRRAASSPEPARDGLCQPERYEVARAACLKPLPPQNLFSMYISVYLHCFLSLKI